MKRYKVNLVESERGWSQNCWYEYYNSYEEALERIKQINSKNTYNIAPEYYIQEEDKIEVIGEDE